MYTTKQKCDFLQKYAPIVYLAKGESYKPSSVEYYINNTTRLMTPGHNREYHQSNLNDMCRYYGSPTTRAFGKHLDYVYGEDANQEAYSYFVEKKDAECFRLVYYFFFPFNNVAWITSDFDHYGDWECFAIDFKGDSPQRARFEAHGSCIPLIDFSEVEKDSITTRPLIYCAKGSHGIWPHAGNNSFKWPQVIIPDVCNMGFRWDTAVNLQMYDYLTKLDIKNNGQPWPTWMNRDYHNDNSKAVKLWGSYGDEHLVYRPAAPVISSGPTGPIEKEVFSEAIA